jgi:hypothetical protein
MPAVMARWKRARLSPSGFCSPAAEAPQQRLYFLPLPQGQGPLRVGAVMSFRAQKKGAPKRAHLTAKAGD